MAVAAASVAAATATTARWGWWGWVVTFCVFVEYFIIFSVIFNYSIFFVYFREEFASGAVLTGWVGCLSNGLAFMLSPLGGFLLSRMGYRAVVMLGVMVYNLGMFATSYVPNIYWAVLTFGVIMATGAAAVWLPACCLVLKWFPNKKSTLASGLGLLGSSVGFTVMAPLMNSLVQAYGWRIALRMTSVGFTAIGLLAGLLLLPPPEKQHQQSKVQQQAKVQKQRKAGDCEEGPDCLSPQSDTHKQGHRNNSISQAPQPECVDKATDVFCEDNFENTKEQKQKNTSILQWEDPPGFCTETKDESEENVRPNDKGFRKLVTEFDVWLFGVYTFMYTIGLSFFAVNFASYITTLGFTPTQAAWAIFAGGVAEVLGKAITACLGDHLPFLKINVITISTLLLAVNVGFLAIVQNWKDVLILSFASGLFRGAINSISNSAAYQLFSKYGREKSLCVMSVGWGFGNLLAPTLTGGLFESSGNYILCLLVLVGLFVMSALCPLAIIIRRRLRCLSKSKGKWKKGSHSDEESSRKAGADNAAFDAGDGA